MNFSHGPDTTVLDELDHLGCAGGECGTLAKFRLTWEDGRIQQARWWGRGPRMAELAPVCNALAIAVEGCTLAESFHIGLTRAQVQINDISMIGEDALHHALGLRLLLAAQRGEVHDSTLEAIVGMSGGVDSAVSLILAHEQHGDVLGATLRLWIDPSGPNPDRACCAPESVRRARHTCHQRGFGHVSIDLRQRFHDVIVAPFKQAYAEGTTPNPCFDCNGAFRLDELVSVADALAARWVVTGHYAQRHVDETGQVRLRRGVDPNKDQTYYLAGMNQQTLERFQFPLGGMHKPQVRELAASYGMVQAKIPGSQEICFLGGGDYRKFLTAHGNLGPVGNLRLVDGTIVGAHEGLATLTPGQRKGIPIDAEKRGQLGPLYVVGRRGNDVIVGSREQAKTTRIHLRALRLNHNDYANLHAQVRHGSRGAVAATLDGNVLDLAEAVSITAPGQVVVLYDRDVVIGSARVLECEAAGIGRISKGAMLV